MSRRAVSGKHGVLPVLSKHINKADMTPTEYNQLRAFARVDGIRLAVVWTASFACYIVSLSTPVLSMAAVVIALATPFVLSRSTKRYAVAVCGGSVSFRRAYLYCLLAFFYASVLFAFVQWIYFAYLDHGTMIDALERVAASPEGRQAVETYGLADQLALSMQQLRAMRPIDIALNLLTSNLLVGLVVSLLSALMARLSSRG